MIGLEVNDVAIVQQKEVLERALSTNPKTKQALQKLIRKVIRQARQDTIRNIHFANGDPRGSRQSVRTSVYQKILGANINIYNSKRSHGTVNYTPKRKARPLKARGGNRVEASERTKKMQGYPPLDRGMILRWVNAGTRGRYAGFGRNGKTEADYERFVLRTGGRGWRGQIAPRNFFRTAGEPAMLKAVDALATMIDEELDNMLNKNKK